MVGPGFWRGSRFRCPELKTHLAFLCGFECSLKFLLNWCDHIALNSLLKFFALRLVIIILEVTFEQAGHHFVEHWN